MYLPFKYSYLFIFFIVLSALYSQPNIGGYGYWLPSNVIVWTSVVLISLLTLYKSIDYGFLRVSSFTYVLTTFLVSLLVIDFINGTNESVLIYSFFLYLAVIAFLLCLDQFNGDKFKLDSFLILISIFGFIVVSISLVQLFDTHSVLFHIFGYEYFKHQQKPLGVFQQVNMLVSFLSFLSVSIVYLILKAKNEETIKYSYFFVLTAALSVYIILISGSRVGLISLFIPVILLIIYFYLNYSIKKHTFRKILFIFLLSILLFYFTPVEFNSVHMLAGKLSNISSGDDIRLYLYEFSIRSITDNLFLGIGSENFSSRFEFYALQNGIHEIVRIDEVTYTHPHNEILNWAVLFGVFPVIFLLGGLSYLFMHSLKTDKERALIGFYLAMPLLIQAQFSYPFSLSAVHLFLLLLLMSYVLNKHAYANFKFQLNNFLRAGAFFSFSFIFVSSVFFSFSTLKSIEEFYYFKNRLFLYQTESYGQYEKKGYFEVSSSNIFFREHAENTMELMLERALKNNNDYDFSKFSQWIENMDTPKKELLNKFIAAQQHFGNSIEFQTE